MKPETPLILLTNARIVQAPDDTVSPPCDILITGDRIARLSSKGAPKHTKRIDLEGRYVLPGLIDCHAHPFLADTNLARLNTVPPTLMTARAGRILEKMLMRGFTSIRDAAGADWGIKQAVKEGAIKGPRLFIAGRALSQTGGHGDMRAQTEEHAPCSCANALAYTSQIADGIDEVRRAVRNNFRLGADQIKIMVSGGVSSPHDPLECTQYSLEEVKVIVEEAERRGSYVMAHAYSSAAIQMALHGGVRTIEHGNLIDESAARLAAKMGAFVVPTLVTYTVLGETAAKNGWSEAMLQKLIAVQQTGLQSLLICRAAGVQLGFGTDLLGDSFDEQSREFLIRGEVESPAQVITSATHINAQILQMQGELGVIAKGALADLIVLDGNPLVDLRYLMDEGRHMALIMKAGTIYKNTL